MHVQRLADRAGHEPDPADWTRRYLNMAWSLREGGKDVWRGQPWAPSAVCSEKMMVRVIEAMDQPELSLEQIAGLKTVGDAWRKPA